MSWNQISFLEEIQIINEPVGHFGGLKYYMATGDLSNDNTKDLETVNYENKPSRASLTAQIGDIIFARMKCTNKVLRVNEHERDYIFSTGFVVIRHSNNIDGQYLLHYLKSNLFQLEKDKLCTGATQKAINNQNLEKLKIPLPPLATQKRIAEILDAADSLRQKDQELLKKYDELAQAIFIDMFGDPVKNEKGWKIENLNDVCLKITDGTHDTPERLTSGIKFITGKHIKPYFIDFENSDYVTEENHFEIYRRCNPEYGDILYTNIGVNYATAAMNTVSYEFSMKNVALLKYKRAIATGRFLEYLLNNPFFKDRLKKITGIGGAQQFLSLSQIKSIKILLPPIELQRRFELLIEESRKSFQILINNNNSGEYLLNSLLQKAFNGELIS